MTFSARPARGGRARLLLSDVNDRAAPKSRGERQLRRPSTTCVQNLRYDFRAHYPFEFARTAASDFATRVRLCGYSRHALKLQKPAIF